MWRPPDGTVDRRAARIVWRRVAAMVVLVALTAAAPAHDSGSVLGPGSVRDARFGFSFDVPAGWLAERAPGGLSYSLRTPQGDELLMEPEDQPPWFDGPLSDPADSLLSFVRQHFGWGCDADGPDGGQHADTLLSLRDTRLPRGFRLIEYEVGVLQVTRDGDVDDDDDDDSSAAAPATAAATPDTAGRSRIAPAATPDTAGRPRIAPAATPDTALTRSVRFRAGPFFIADLSRPGGRLRVRVSPDCSEPAEARTIETARAVIRSLRRP